MSDAFSDVTESTEDSTSEDDTTTISQTVTDTFTDDVRSTIPGEDENVDDKRYEETGTDEKADDVDPRGLFKQPTLNELRYYAREGPYGKTIIEQPIEDVFKHGFEIEGDNTERQDGTGKIEDFLKDEYLPYYKKCEVKSRRDGLTILMHQIADGAESVSEPIPADGGTFQNFKIWTLDNLTDDLADSTVAEYTEYDYDQIYVSEGPEHGGVALVDDISHPDHGEVVGYGVEPRQDSEDVDVVSFVHADRCQTFLWGEHVDGPLGNNLRGDHIGESVLTPILQPLMATQMGYWAMKNILHRYSAPLHAVEPPESWGPDEFDDARNKLGNISMNSEAVLPPGSELNVAEGVSEFDPEPIYNVLVESICAGTEFTKSYLQGTQTGTVSGSETDLKGYFSNIELLRQERTANKFHEIVQQVASYDQSTIPRVSGVSTFTIDWGPLFRPTSAEQAEGAVSLVTAATNAIKSYVLTPDEARSLVAEEWAEFEIDVDLDELSEDEWDSLDRINMNEAGQGASDNDPDSSPRENPRVGNGGGGQPAGQTRESSQPVRDSLSEDELDEIAKRLADYME